MSVEEKAIKLFNEGFNCSQAVIKAFSEKLNFDESLASALSLGFGGGMGRLQETCGAVTGAFMALGIYNDRLHIQLANKKNGAYEMVQKFNEKFIKLNKSIKCSELLGCSLVTEEGKDFYKTNNLNENVCQKCIRDAVKIVEELI